MAESLNFREKTSPSYRILSTRVLPRHLELALGLLYQLEIKTVTHRRSRSFFELKAQMPSKTPAGFILKRILGFRALPKGEKIFFHARIKTLKKGAWVSSHLRFLQPFVLKAPLADPELPALLRIDPREKKSALRSDTLFVKSSLAFGTGSHPTTQMAAELLWEALVQGKKDGKKYGSVLDAGCGTGILAMVAKRLKSPQVVAVDNDPVALEMARENFVRNGIKVKRLDDLKKVKGRYDVVVANILLSTLTELKKDLERRLQAKGFLIVSGLLYRDVLPLRKAYSKFRLVKRKNRKGWSALLLKKGP